MGLQEDMLHRDVRRRGVRDQKTLRESSEAVEELCQVAEELLM
jgi:hypothetical protein